MRKRVNWPLALGGVLILFVVFVAIAGPSLAPRDPLQANPVIQVDGKWIPRPFPPFTPGFPLGSDRAGRDLWSWLLWGVRPTLIMIVLVAAVRLTLGIAIGLAAGWSVGRLGRVLDALISAALSVPVLIAALIAISAFGAAGGLLPFLVGLSVTGWVDTAQVVREQTRIVKSQTYVEAARAVGESGAQIIVRHVRRQIMPLVWMLLAFEIGGTLMTTAGLGFLGYYVGGDYLVQAADYVLVREAGLPELGQMLHTSWVLFNQPWPLLAAGSVIYVTILGFNLLGEGMRAQLGVAAARQSRLYSATLGRIGEWIDARVLLPVSNRARRIAFGGTLAVALIAAVGLGMNAIRPSSPGEAVSVTPTTGVVFVDPRTPRPLPTIVYSQTSPITGSLSGLTVPGDHLWASKRHDPWGTLWTPAIGPTSPEIRWTFTDEAGFSSGPAVAADGTLYLASRGGTLYALDPNGNVIWQVALPAEAIGSPALDAGGNVYVVDKEGLSAFSPDGDALWRFVPEDMPVPSAGPIVAPDGMIYYTLRGDIQAVSPDGEGLWRQRSVDAVIDDPPRLSPDDDWLFLAEGVSSATDGSRFDTTALTVYAGNFSGQRERHFAGADSRIHMRAGGQIVEWQPALSGVEILTDTARGFYALTFRDAKDIGVTPDGILWGHYGEPRAPALMVWIDSVGNPLGAVAVERSRSWLIGVDRLATAYVCAEAGASRSMCFAASPGSDKPIWEVELDGGKIVAGGAVVPGRTYVVLREGHVFAIGAP